MTTRELQATQKAVAKNLRRLARKLSTGSLEDAGEIRRAIRYDADAPAGLRIALQMRKAHRFPAGRVLDRRHANNRRCGCWH